MKNYIKKNKYISNAITLLGTLLLQAKAIKGTWTGELKI